MSATCCRRQFRRSAAAILALAAIGLVAPNMVSGASCGSHAASRVHLLDVTALSELRILDVFGREAAVPANDPSGRPPCTGLSCSRAPVLPLVPATGDPTRIDEWGCLTPFRLPEPDPFAILIVESEVRAIHSGSRLDRPPRPPVFDLIPTTA